MKWRNRFLWAFLTAIIVLAIIGGGILIGKALLGMGS